MLKGALVVAVLHIFLRKIETSELKAFPSAIKEEKIKWRWPQMVTLQGFGNVEEDD